MNIRKLASLGLGIATVVVTLTGIFLFFGIGDHNVMVLAHEVFSITFILFVVIHIALNFKLLRSYFAARKEVVINIAIAAVFVIVIAKVTLSRPKSTYSDYPATEAIALEAVLAAGGIDYDEALNALRSKGLAVPEGDLTLGALAQANQMNPHVIYGTMAAGNGAAQDRQQ